ncbi:hypothetical protein ACQY0O_004283 [Thecaphora frezii]
MPAKLPFFSASDSLQQKWAEALSSNRLTAQLYVFILILSVGLIRHYLYPATAPTAASRRATDFHGKQGAEGEIVAAVDTILIYPIKSCAAVELDYASLTQKGFELDRRWMVVRAAKSGSEADEQIKWQKVSLREEPRLTLVVPTIDEEANLLRLGISDRVDDAAGYGSVQTPLRPTRTQLQKWKLLSRLEMWGDHADGRIVESSPIPPSSADGVTVFVSPSEWLSRFLGYPVLLLHFDVHSSVQRAAFPIYRPPSDIDGWSGEAHDELVRPRGIEFADEYPLLVATVESLEAVQAQIRDAARASLPGGAGGDGRGGRVIGGLDAALWSGDKELDVRRFRPNLVLCRLPEPSQLAYLPFSEDKWERLSLLRPRSTSHQPAQEEMVADLAMVARCQRCLLTAVDPVTAHRDASVPLKFLTRTSMKVKKTHNPLGSQLGALPKGKEQRAGPCFGVYAIPLPVKEDEGREGKEQRVYGSIQVGDQVRVAWRPEVTKD